MLISRPFSLIYWVFSLKKTIYSIFIQLYIFTYFSSTIYFLFFFSAATNKVEDNNIQKRWHTMFISTTLRNKHLAIELSTLWLRSLNSCQSDKASRTNKLYFISFAIYSILKYLQIVNATFKKKLILNIYNLIV